MRRFTVDEYLRLGETGILAEGERVELLEGFIVQKMTRIPRHDAAIDILSELLRRLLPLAWYPRDQKVLLTTDSAPEPDLAVVRGQPRDYWNAHPTAADSALVIEVSESSLDRDRRKCRIYARGGIPTYWIIDLDSQRIEVLTEPDSALGEYRKHEIVPLATAVAFALPGGALITLPLDMALQFTA